MSSRTLVTVFGSQINSISSKNALTAFPVLRTKISINVMAMKLRKKALFGLICTLTIVLFGLSVAEWGLRFQRDRIFQKERLDSGLIQFDSMTGWKMKPGWSGRHRNHDFEVQYSINEHGFRGEFPNSKRIKEGGIAILGDSFTFGFGVEEGNTFVDRLKKYQNGQQTTLNFGVPGFSTDQQYLLLTNAVDQFSPKKVVLVTYLANDLFDNLLKSPLQVELAKPYFELQDDGLVLRKPEKGVRFVQQRLEKPTLESMVLGDNVARSSLFSYLERSILFGKAVEMFEMRQLKVKDMEKRYAEALEMYFALVREMNSDCVRQGREFTVSLLPGRSFVYQKESVSSQYQDFFRKAILQWCKMNKVECIDLGLPLRIIAGNNKSLYFPNDGHLTEEGNRYVAEVLMNHLHF